MICGKCGQHTSYREQECHQCGAKLHQKGCLSDRTCTCHTENLKTWETNKPQENVANVNGKKSESTETSD